MTLSENDFLLELESDKLSLKTLFSEAGKYDCPCKRKKMTNADWHKYKNGYMQKVWKLLHERSFKYLENPSDDVQKKVFNFFNNDVKAIPCWICRRHYTEFISKNDLKKACQSRDKLCKFLIDLHNDVNKDTKKPIMSYQDVFKLYGYEYNNKIFSYPIRKVTAVKESVVVENKPIVVENKPIVVENKPIVIENKRIKLTSNSNSMLQDRKAHFMALNQKINNKSIYSSNVSGNRNSIIKKGMMRAINRGKR